PQICAVIQAESGRKIERRYAGPLLLRPNESVAFSVIFEPPMASEAFSVEFAAAKPTALNRDTLAGMVYRDFNISTSITPDKSRRQVDVHGLLENSGALPAGDIFVAIGLYDAQGNLIGVAKDKFKTGDILAPGETLTFTLPSSQLTRIPSDIKMRVFAEGQIDRNPIVGGGS
ncbi:MAG: FxLYD domain-containing protein, partial [Anaerolineae bacterium]|nr:FxLYD domain-containing protein [Thermoflexales bacterium]MDW8406617.1 FxLYD domain-containing protein [Anaerolineae bacterium]